MIVDREKLTAKDRERPIEELAGLLQNREEAAHKQYKEEINSHVETAQKLRDAEVEIDQLKQRNIEMVKALAEADGLTTKQGEVIEQLNEQLSDLTKALGVTDNGKEIIRQNKLQKAKAAREKIDEQIEALEKP